MFNAADLAGRPARRGRRRRPHGGHRGAGGTSPTPSCTTACAHSAPACVTWACGPGERVADLHGRRRRLLALVPRQRCASARCPSRCRRCSPRDDLAAVAARIAGAGAVVGLGGVRRQLPSESPRRAPDLRPRRARPGTRRRRRRSGPERTAGRGRRERRRRRPVPDERGLPRACGSTRSGTTGLPKGAMHRHASIRVGLRDVRARRCSGSGPTTAACRCAKLFFAYGSATRCFFPLVGRRDGRARTRAPDARR